MTCECYYRWRMKTLTPCFRKRHPKSQNNFNHTTRIYMSFVLDCKWLGSHVEHWLFLRVRMTSWQQTQWLDATFSFARLFDTHVVAPTDSCRPIIGFTNLVRPTTEPAWVSGSSHWIRTRLPGHWVPTMVGTSRESLGALVPCGHSHLNYGGNQLQSTLSYYYTITILAIIQWNKILN